MANEGEPGIFLFEDFISKLSPNGETITQKFIDGLEGSSGLVVDEQGNIYVSQDVELPLRKYNSLGELILVFEPHRPNFSDPNTLALTNDGRLLAAVENCSSDKQWRILAFDIQSGKRLNDFTPQFEYDFVNSIVFKDGQLFIAGTPLPGTGLGPLLVAQEAQAPTSYPFNCYPKCYLNGLAVGSSGEVYGTNSDELLRVHPDGSVSILAQGFEFPRGVKEREGCVLVSEFRQGFNGSLYQVCPVKEVKIDIKPGSFPNSINPKSKGKIPVAILTSETFDATTVDAATILFGATGTEAVPSHYALEDVDRDGDIDMILHFNNQETNIVCGDTSATLTGETFSGQAIKGSDSIKTVGCK